MKKYLIISVGMLFLSLTIYALALSRRTGLPVKAFKCAYFDERDYFEFYPLPAVYPRK